ncbi:MAG: hypothetical protein HFE74_03895 [Firmicutes bacterium]|jgi:hypothetical protein|nr:hypothetical protein [Bacillota bacterium]
MAFMDKLGQMANKVGEVAGDTFDYGKAKGKIVLERGKVKDVKEAIGEYVYNAMKADDNVDLERLRAFCAEIDQHFDEIEKLNNDAKQSGEDLSEAFGGNE